jgi:hypothetical protein
MEKLQKRVQLRDYLRKLIKEVAMREKLYNEDSVELNPERYIRNEYKNYNN